MNYTTETFEPGSEFRVTTWEIVPKKNGGFAHRKTNSFFTNLEEAEAYADTFPDTYEQKERLEALYSEGTPFLESVAVMVRQPGNKNFTSTYWAKKA